jgi:hypothetical protein
VNFLFTGCGTIEKAAEEGIPTFWDYLASIGSLIILFSPTLIIYWALMKKTRIATNKTG